MNLSKCFLGNRDNFCPYERARRKHHYFEKLVSNDFSLPCAHASAVLVLYYVTTITSYGISNKNSLTSQAVLFAH